MNDGRAVEPGPVSGADIVAGKRSETATEATSIVGVREEFIAFYDQEYALVVRFCMRCGAGLQAAEDATQEAFRYAWEHYVLTDTWAKKVLSPKAWIRTVAFRNYRNQNGRGRPGLVLLPVYPENLYNSNDDWSDELSVQTLTVLDALSCLEPQLRAIVAFRLDGFKAQEIADELGIADAQQVRDLLKKARKNLAAKLGLVRNQGGRVS